MKRLLTLALFAVLMLPAVAQELTVATYNIRNANKGDAERGNGWERRCPWVCGLIEFQGFDIFGSQEVLDGQLHDMLAQLPGYAYIGVGRDDGKAKGEYSPIFYKKERFRLLDEGHFWLSEVTDRPNKGWDAALPRICTWGHFLDRQTRRRFWFFNLHMDHVGVRAREESAKLVVAKIREMCGPREFVILTGDFNVDQNNPIYTTFTTRGYWPIRIKPRPGAMPRTGRSTISTPRENRQPYRPYFRVAFGACARLRGADGHLPFADHPQRRGDQVRSIPQGGVVAQL